MKKTILITGSTSPIGQVLAKELAKCGYDILLHYFTDENKALCLKEDLKKFGVCTEIFRADLSKKDAIVNLFSFFKEKFDSPLWGLVNNAGYSPKRTSFEGQSSEEIEKIVNINVLGSCYVTQQAISLMKHKGGRVLMISSQAGTFGGNCLSMYAASKGALNTFTIGLAREVGKYGISVNSISPGIIDTPSQRFLSENHKQEIINTIPLKRLGKPEDVAGVVKWLISEEAEYISGINIPVSGGR